MKCLLNQEPFHTKSKDDFLRPFTCFLHTAIRMMLTILLVPVILN